MFAAEGADDGNWNDGGATGDNWNDTGATNGDFGDDAGVNGHGGSGETNGAAADGEDFKCHR